MYCIDVNTLAYLVNVCFTIVKSFMAHAPEVERAIEVSRQSGSRSDDRSKKGDKSSPLLFNF